MGFSRFL